MDMRSIRSDDAGGALVEFALAASTMVLLLVGTTQFGLMRYEWSQVNKLVQAGTFYVIKRADNLYGTSPFSASGIISGVGNSVYGDSLSVASGCACPSNSGLTAADLTAFSDTPPKCDQSLVCNGNTTTKMPYVILSAQHTHSTLGNWWNMPPVTGKAIIRIQ
jgi:Flp pilus assembly protein TadG